MYSWGRGGELAAGHLRPSLPPEARVLAVPRLTVARMGSGAAGICPRLAQSESSPMVLAGQAAAQGQLLPFWVTPPRRGYLGSW